MENEEKEMTGEESLKLISDMINKAKINLNQSSFYLLFWGWLVFFCSLTEYILANFTDFSRPWYVWWLMVPGVLISLLYGWLKGRKETVYTYAGIIYTWTWMGFLVTGVVLFIVSSDNYENIAALILMLVGLPTFISGFIIKFRPLIIGGIIFWICALAAHFIGHSSAPLATAVATLTGYLIPGYMLKRKADHDTI